MIKVTTEVINLIGVTLMATVFALYLWQFFRMRKADKAREAYWEAQHKKMEKDHEEFLARMGGATRPPPTPPEN